MQKILLAFLLVQLIFTLHIDAKAADAAQAVTNENHELEPWHQSEYCGASQEEKVNEVGCGKKGKCWMWCGGNGGRAANAWVAEGKWCYTSTEHICGSRAVCNGFATCFRSNCNTNC